MSGMIGSKPWTTNALGFVNDSYRYALQSIPGLRVPHRAPIGPWPAEVGEQIGRARAQAVARGAAAGAVVQLLSRAASASGVASCRKRERLRHLGLELRDDMGHRRVEPNDDERDAAGS